MKAPCRDCTDRTLGCHSNCKKYKAFREFVDAENKKKKEYRARYCLNTTGEYRYYDT